MIADQVPDTLYIRGQLWRVEWVDHEDEEWRSEPREADCDRQERVIRLDSTLRHRRTRLGEVFLHEVLHACLPEVVRDGRPRGFDRDLEELVVDVIAPYLELVLNQVGWDGVRS